MHKNFKPALKDCTDVCKFETWLRFYFVQEKGKELIINIPQKTLEHINSQYEYLSKLAQQLNNAVITPEKSKTAVTHFINQTLDGVKYQPGLIQQVLDSKDFTTELSAFNIWVNAHEDQLDQRVMDFQEWMQFFEAWKRTEKGQNTLLGLSTPETVHTTTTTQ